MDPKTNPSPHPEGNRADGAPLLTHSTLFLMSSLLLCNLCTSRHRACPEPMLPTASSLGIPSACSSLNWAHHQCYCTQLGATLPPHLKPPPPGASKAVRNTALLSGPANTQGFLNCFILQQIHCPSILFREAQARIFPAPGSTWSNPEGTITQGFCHPRAEMEDQQQQRRKGDI